MKVIFDGIVCGVVLVSFLMLWQSAAYGETRKFTVRTGLERLWDISKLPELRPEKLRQASSGAVYPLAKDGAEFLYRESDGEYVLFDATGPGCVVRYWSALIVPGTRIRFYFDGHTTPDIDMHLADMFTGQTFPWLHPVVGNDTISSGGFYSYLPIPYEKGCKVTLDRIPSFYHLEWLNLPEYDRVETFDLPKAGKYRAAVEKAVEKLKSVGFPDLPKRARSAKSATVKRGEAFALVSLDGPGVIDTITLKLEPHDPDTLREVLIRAFWDGESSPSVWSPIGDFFVSGHQKTEFRALPLGSTQEGFYCRFPMPFAKSAKLELVNESGKDVAVEYRVLDRKIDACPEDWGRFHARWSRVETKIGEYVTLLNARGRGKYVGISFNPQSISPWMLEGDEVVWADGELTPSIHGTGTEDYFNGAWYFNKGQFSLATHGAPLLELVETGLRSRVSLYRFHLLDPISFSERIRVCIEHGQERSMQGSDYCFTAFWYQTEPHVPRFPTPAAPERLATAAPVLEYIKRFGEWQDAVKQKFDDKVTELGMKLIAHFPNEANLNQVRYRTGQALRRLGRVNDAVEVWRSAQDYWGIDFAETDLCATEAWVLGGQKGEPPKAMLEIQRLDKPQKPGSFDPAVWNALPVATDFHPNFPNPYFDLAADVQTEVRMAYDDASLYLWVRCWEPSMEELGVPREAGETFNFKEDGFVLCVDAERSYETYTFVAVDPKGRVWVTTDVRGSDERFGQTEKQEGKPVLPPMSAEAVAQTESDCWVVELRIPRDLVGLKGDISNTISGLGFIRLRNSNRERPESTMWGTGIVSNVASQFGLARFE